MIFFLIIHADHIHLSLEELNNQYSQNIHLTCETEVNSCIQLLDVMITKEPDSAVSTAKDSASDRHILGNTMHRRKQVGTRSQCHSLES